MCNFQYHLPHKLEIMHITKAGKQRVLIIAFHIFCHLFIELNSLDKIFYTLDLTIQELLIAAQLLPSLLFFTQCDPHKYTAN